jgi:FkbM family methyltransferase
VGDESRKSVVDGHKYICGYDKIIGSPIVYSYGSNQNQIFEQALLKLRPDSKIFVFDISEEKLPIKELRDKKISYIPIALGGYQNKSVNFLTLKDMMKKNKHTYIDVLKMDIEAAEYDWLKYEGDLLRRIGQLSVELHINDQVRSWYPPLNTKMITWFVSTVESYGHRMFYKEINRMVQDCCSEFSFIQSKFTTFEKSKFLNSAL